MTGSFRYCYSLIRYIPDLARGEAFNVGVVVWSADDYRLCIDPRAVGRVIRETPHLPPTGLESLEVRVRHELRLNQTGGEIERQIENQRGYPLTFTEPRGTSQGNSLEEALSELIARLVAPPRRGAPKTVQRIARRLRPLLQSRTVVQRHLFTRTRSGTPREVAFFANAAANTALDVGRLNVKQPRAVEQRIDAMAFKVQDVLAANRVRFVVYCVLPEAEGERAAERARRVIGAAGGEVVTSVEDAIRSLQPVPA